MRESKKESIINEKEAAVKKNEEVKPEKKNEETAAEKQEQKPEIKKEKIKNQWKKNLNKILKKIVKIMKWNKRRMSNEQSRICICDRRTA